EPAGLAVVEIDAESQRQGLGRAMVHVGIEHALFLAKTFGRRGSRPLRDGCKIERSADVERVTPGLQDMARRERLLSQRDGDRNWAGVDSVVGVGSDDGKNPRALPLRPCFADSDGVLASADTNRIRVFGE